jgi:hypothetical protein
VRTIVAVNCFGRVLKRKPRIGKQSRIEGCNRSNFAREESAIQTQKMVAFMYGICQCDSGLKMSIATTEMWKRNPTRVTDS